MMSEAVYTYNASVVFLASKHLLEFYHMYPMIYSGSQMYCFPQNMFSIERSWHYNAV